MARSLRDRVRDSLGAGAITWLGGSVFAAGILALFSSVPATPAAFLATAVVFYYTFHLWPLVLVPGDLSATAAVFAPVAMGLLFWAGFRHAIRNDAASGREGARLGAEVVPGYLVLAVLSLPAFRVAVGDSLLAEPTGAAVVVGTTGVAFPLVFGGLGGWIAGR